MGDSGEERERVGDSGEERERVGDSGEEWEKESGGSGEERERESGVNTIRVSCDHSSDQPFLLPCTW